MNSLIFNPYFHAVNAALACFPKWRPLFRNGGRSYVNTALHKFPCNRNELNGRADRTDRKEYFATSSRGVSGEQLGSGE